MLYFTYILLYFMLLKRKRDELMILLYDYKR